MNDLTALVISVMNKANKLVEKHEQLLGKYQTLNAEVEELKIELKEKNQQLLALNDKNKLLKLAKNVDGESTKEVKLKINEMVREIDKCIAQINR